MDLEGQLKMYENSVGDMNKKDGYDCPICKNKGFTFFIRGDEIVRDKCYIQAFLREEGGLRSKTEGDCVTKKQSIT